MRTPGAASSQTSSRAGPAPTHRARGARRRAGPGVAPEGAFGRLRGVAPRSSRPPQGAGAHPETRRGPGGGGQPKGAPFGCPRYGSWSRGKCAQARSVRSPGTARSRPRPARPALGAPRPEPVGLRPVLADGQPAPAFSPRRPAVSRASRSALCPRSRPIARIPRARLALPRPPPPPLSGRGGICAGRGLLSRPLPPAAL